MANFVSPGVYIQEKDNSNFPVSVNPSVVGIVGYASMGPTNSAKLITSQEALIKEFGNPAESIDGQGLEGALEILEATNAVRFVRAADSGTEADASANVPMGACGALLVSGDSYGITGGNNLYLDVQVAVDGVNLFSSPKQFDIPAGTLGAGATQADALKKIIGGSLEGAAVGLYYDSASTASGYLAAGYAGSGVTMAVSAYSTTARTAAVGLPALVPLSANGNGNQALVASAVTVSGMTFTKTGANGLSYLVESVHPGAGYNYGTKADGTASGFQAQVLRTGSHPVTLQVNREGAAAESFKVSFVGSGTFIEEVINTGEIDLTSEYIKGNIVSGDTDFTASSFDNFVERLSNMGVAAANIQGIGLGEAALATNVNPRFIKLVEGTTNLAGGNNGILGAGGSYADIIGTVADKTGLYALDDPLLNISMAVIPGITDESVQNALVTLAESTQEFLAVLSPPEGYTTVSQAIDWTNGQADERNAALNSSYAACYWPWVQVFDTFAAKDRWMDPAVFATRQMCFTDETAEPWFAPAGVVRGRLTKPTEVEVRLNQGDRDSMYSGGNIVNPIVNFPQQGMMIFGQRTTQRDPTALDRVNVRRLLIQVRKQVLASTRRFIFEPNDATTWEKLVQTVQPMLDDIRRRRGLTDFKVICDETTNTPVRVDRNELWCKVLLKPTKAAEVVVIELDLTNQSAKF